MVSTDILLTGFGLVWCLESKFRIKQVPNVLKWINTDFVS